MPRRTCYLLNWTAKAMPSVWFFVSHPMLPAIEQSHVRVDLFKKLALHIRELFIYVETVENGRVCPCSTFMRFNTTWDNVESVDNLANCQVPMFLYLSQFVYVCSGSCCA